MNDKDKRTSMLQVRVTSAEKEEITRAAQDRGRSVSSYLRAIALGREVVRGALE